MRNGYIIIGLALFFLISGGVLAFARLGNGKTTAHDETHAQRHTDHDHEDEHEDERGENDHGAHGHGASSGVVEMSKAQQRQIDLKIAVAGAGDIQTRLSLVGEVRLHADRMAHIVPRVPGIVHTVAVGLGDKVREGQTLALIDSPELAELKADYLEKERHLDVTRRTYERKQYLKKENIASEADWLEAQSAFLNAKTALRSAKRRLIVLGMKDERIRAIADAQDEAFGRYTLRSPIDGTVISKHISRGEKIGEEEVFIIADLSMVWVDLQIPAKDLSVVKTGQRVTITTPQGAMAEGTLTLVGPVVNTETRTALGRVELANPDGNWRPGLFVTGRIHGGALSSSVVVPSGAVQNIDGEHVVFVPDGDGFKPVDVSPGRTFKVQTEILSGLKPGQRYVVQGAFELKAVIETRGAGAHAGHGH
ncbi:MAG: efflux RND transporter periplasmic adaptor subunit [Desulfatitalea sp.]|nr:efflux RND transporter periplasmic adaptor subunit [Desulfatitalea sp.]NNK01156.1 efflux RND transporter periplasmic adaptor subunit [Desulfatitalea sp.]